MTTSNVERDETICDKCGTLVSVRPLSEWNDGDLCHNCAQDCLRNLLAVIHKDGGQFACDHGMKQACEDAESNVQALSDRVAELEKERAVLVGEIAANRNEVAVIRKMSNVNILDSVALMTHRAERMKAAIEVAAAREKTNSLKIEGL